MRTLFAAALSLMAFSADVSAQTWESVRRTDAISAGIVAWRVVADEVNTTITAIVCQNGQASVVLAGTGGEPPVGSMTVRVDDQPFTISFSDNPVLGRRGLQGLPTSSAPISGEMLRAMRQGSRLRRPDVQRPISLAGFGRQWPAIERACTATLAGPARDNAGGGIAVASTPVVAPSSGPCPSVAEGLRGASGTLTCTCAPGATQGGSVWGSGVYTSDSSICRAAVHAGAVGIGGGTVSFQMLPGRASYEGSARNGVSTMNYGSWRGSFAFVAAAIANPTPAASGSSSSSVGGDRGAPFGVWVFPDGRTGQCVDGGPGFAIDRSSIFISSGGETQTWNNVSFQSCTGDICIFQQRGTNLRWSTRWLTSDRIILNGPHLDRRAERTEGIRENVAARCSMIR